MLVFFFFFDSLYFSFHENYNFFYKSKNSNKIFDQFHLGGGGGVVVQSHNFCSKKKLLCFSTHAYM